MEHVAKTFWMLIIGHSLADYPLQGEFLAKAKNHLAPIPGIQWWIALAAHASIHGGFVWIFTGNVWLGIAETLTHFYIDHLKCDNKIGFIPDQSLHLACKFLWALA